MDTLPEAIRIKLAGVNKTIEQAMRHQQKLLQSVRLGEELGAALAQAQQQAYQVVGASTRIQQSIDQVLGGFAQHAKRIQELWIEVERDLDRYGEIMLELGWPPPREPPIPMLRQMVRLYDRGEVTGEEVSAAFVDFYGEDELLTMLERWEGRPFLKRRIPILREVVEGHLDGRYALTVPTVLAQVDGVLGDVFGHRGQLWGATLMAYAEELLSDGLLGEDVLAFYVERIREPAEFGAPEIPQLSRHAVLHGIDTEYGTESKSLRAILLFNYVQEAVGVVVLPHRGRFHRAHCSAIVNSRNRKVLSSAERAVREGYVACQRCSA